MRILCIYDNHIMPNVFIKNIIGEKTFGEVILKRKSIKNKFYDFIGEEKYVDEIIELNYLWQLDHLIDKVKNVENNVRIIHIFSNFVVLDEEKVKNIFSKAPYINGNYAWVTDNNIPIIFMMKEAKEYCEFILKAVDNLDDCSIYTKYNAKFEFVRTDAFINLAQYSNFLQYISGGFDARFFNAVSGDEFIVTKSSKNVHKIRAEYEFYYLLPDEMKMWFVMPYNYTEKKAGASYDMERYHMTDLAIRWVHGAIDIEEMNTLLSKVFRFIKTRKRKTVSPLEYKRLERYLYIDKLETRIETLKKHKMFTVFSGFIKNGTEYDDLEQIVDEYKRLYDLIQADMDVEYFSVIGHGDLCFSNMLFNKEANLLKLIDPKGALLEEELWTNPYYDIAKLSHSVCGLYDFFNNGLHQISLNDDLRFQVSIQFDNCEYKKLFRKFIEENGYSYMAVRIYECSLFLSMLPLHMDNPQKVFGFMLNAINILKEIEECLKK